MKTLSSSSSVFQAPAPRCAAPGQSAGAESIPNWREGGWRAVTRQYGKLLAWGAVFVIGVPWLVAWLPGLQSALLWLNAFGRSPAGLMWFLAGGTAYCACGLSRQALGLIAGSLFGPVGGIVAISGPTLGAAALIYGVSVWAARRGERNGNKKNRGKRKKPLAPMRLAFGARMRQALEERPFQTVLALRLFPVSSALLVSACCGVWKVRFGSFLAATLTGSLPQNFIFVLAGNGMRLNSVTQALLAMGLLLLSGGVGLGCARKFLTQAG